LEKDKRRNKVKNLILKFKQRENIPPRQGFGIVIVILVLAFLLSIGLVLLTVTATGPKVAGNVRWQEEAFSAAEAGFDAAYNLLEGNFSGIWTSFDTHYLEEPTGIDDPLSTEYLRKKTDEELLNMLGNFETGSANYTNVLFYKTEYINIGGTGLDSQRTYTVFLIDDEAGAPSSDPGDALMVCIGCVELGSSLVTSRIEIELALQGSGT
jgi:hypothetical protein